MKFGTALVSSLILFLLIVSGCSAAPAATSPDPVAAQAPAATAPAQPAEPQKALEISFWYAGGKTAVDVLAGIIDEFNQSQNAFHVSAVTQADYTETYQKLQAAIAGGNAPDLVLLNPDSAQNLGAKSLIEDLRPLMDSDPSFAKDDYVEAFTKSAKLGNGVIYGIPAYGTTQVLYYNIAAFERSNIDPSSIKTWQDLGEAARKMAVIENGETVFYGWEPMYGLVNLIDASLSNGAKLFSDDGTKVLVNSPEWVEVWEQFRVWIHDEKIMGIHYGGQGWEYWYKTIDDVIQDKAGGYTGSAGDQADLDFSKVAALEQPGFGSNPSAPLAEGLFLAIPNRDKRELAQGAFEFMKFFTSPESQAKWTLGTGYVAVRKSTLEVPEFKAYAAENPQILVPLQQVQHGTPSSVDPTGGLVLYALNVAADKVEIENISAQEALDEAQAAGQEALDEILAGQ
ncbi:MAG: ABC transporter substrate-binding protein [Clostridiales bacterium]|nr:ABC transporter substrate-binding protein [Clostridiales bacterium]MDR2749655.1 ABC transporter substrate-binding protein [Clostridiales bacterium]